VFKKRENQVSIRLENMITLWTSNRQIGALEATEKTYDDPIVEIGSAIMGDNA
jgi:hypothetical protein